MTKGLRIIALLVLAPACIQGTSYNSSQCEDDSGCPTHGTDGVELIQKRIAVESSIQNKESSLARPLVSEGTIAARESHTCAILDNDQFKCWGKNQYGQLGYEDQHNRGDGKREMGDNLKAVDLGSKSKVKALALGDRHSCALLENGQVKCWGHNRFGQLGYEDTRDRGDEKDEMGDNLKAVDLGSEHKVKALALGSGHSCALLENGQVKCWGNNFHGQLGYEDTHPRGGEEDEMGDNLKTVDLGSKVKALAAGDRHSCALLEDGQVKCWGWNQYGQLGYEDTHHRGDDKDEMGDNLKAVDLGSKIKVKALALGSGHSCALLENGQVKCWGQNQYGQLGYEDTHHRGDEEDEMGDHLKPVDLGSNKMAEALVSGSGYVCAVLKKGQVKCWGTNVFGSRGCGHKCGQAMGDDLKPVDFGSGRRVKEYTPPPETIDELARKVRAVSRKIESIQDAPQEAIRDLDAKIDALSAQVSKLADNDEER